jgi:threonine/homoserine/homoserine lactone efflux protein
MISLSTLFLYTAGALAIINSPGPDFIYVTIRGIAQGRLRLALIRGSQE